MDENKLVCNGRLYEVEGVSLRNFMDEDVSHWERPRAIKVDEIIVHESVTRSYQDTVNVLEKRGLGVHLLFDSDGTVYQHADIKSDWMYHAGPEHNKRSIGLEIVTPYYPRYIPKGGPWKEHVTAPFASEGEYVLPTPEQLESLALMVEFITNASNGLDTAVPRLWQGYDLDNQRMYLKRPPTIGGAGVYAHQYFAHADGGAPVYYCWLRLEAGLDKEDAYQAMIDGVKGAIRYIDVAPFDVNECKPAHLQPPNLV